MKDVLQLGNVGKTPSICLDYTKEQKFSTSTYYNQSCKAKKCKFLNFCLKKPNKLSS